MLTLLHESLLLVCVPEVERHIVRARGEHALLMGGELDTSHCIGVAAQCHHLLLRGAEVPDLQSLVDRA